jgi:DNA-binding transcriptional regulator YhcF (GntR family)
LVSDTTGRNKDEMGEEEYKLELKKILKHYRLSKVTMQKIYRWMKALGFRYEMRRKGYYVDGHENYAIKLLKDGKAS